MKFFKNMRGFSLIEIMVALGITSAVILVIMNAQKQSMRTTSDLQLNNEVNELIQLITSQLSSVEVCNKNLKGLSITATTPNILSIKNQTDNDIINVNMPYGEKISLINDIQLYIPAANRAYLEVTYTRAKNTSEQQRQIIPASEKFQVYFDVFSDIGDATRIGNCFSDIKTAIQLAVQNACNKTGNGVTGNSTIYTPYTASTYGSCEQTVTLTNAALNKVGATVVDAMTNKYFCPNGEFLSEISHDNAEGRILKCAKFQTNAPSCPAWYYMSGVQSDGSPHCISILNLFPSNGILAVEAQNTYKIVNITCPVGWVLQNIGSGFGAPTCLNPNISQNCPPGQAAYGTDSNGTLLCKNYVEPGPCAMGMYLTAIYTDGTTKCEWPTLTGTCTSPQVTNGTTAAGAVTCVTNPN